MVASVIASVNSKQSYEPSDFMPSLVAPPREMSAEETTAMLNTLAATFAPPATAESES